MSTWQDNADEYGRHVRNGGAELSLLVAKSVKPGVRQKASATGDSKANGPAADRKCSSTEFAGRAKVSKMTVAAHLKAWDDAIELGIKMPDRERLSPSSQVKLPVRFVSEWSTIYVDPFANKKRSPSPKDVTAEQVKDAVTSNPEAAKAAMKGLKERAAKQADSLPKITKQQRDLIDKEMDAKQDNVIDQINAALSPVQVEAIVATLEELTNDIKDLVKAFGPQGVPEDFIHRIDEALAGFNEELNVARMTSAKGGEK